MSKKPSLTARKLIAMLGENTGRAMLDSGGAYGRNFERNQGRAWIDEPPVSVEFDEHNGKLEVSATINVFHFLCQRLTYDPQMQARFTRFAKRADNQERHWLALMQAFPETLDARPFTVNTYNGEDALSQTLQYTAFEYNDTAYCLLQIHGGCDVRGGYTAPVVFTFDEGSIYDLTDNAKVTLAAGKTGGLWDSDNDGFSFAPQELYDGEGLFGAIYRKSPDLQTTPTTRDASKLGDGIHFVVIGKAAYAPNGEAMGAY